MKGKTLLGCLFLALPWTALADKGDASLRFEYQFTRTGAFDSSIGDIDIGNTDAHVFMLAGDYALTDKWTVVASLPYVKKRHQGALPHDPVADFEVFTPPDLSLIDDGNFHSDWEDLYVGVSYLAKDGPLTIKPFISFGVPTNDYPFYAHAAVARNIWHVPVGASFSYTPYFSDFYFTGGLSYVFTEKTLGVDTSHWLLDASVSYYLTPRFAPKIFLMVKHGTQGLDWPDDFILPDELDSEKFYVHDRIIKHNYKNAGIGFDWSLNDKYQLSGSWLTMIDPDQVNIIEYAFSLGITRFFSAD